MKICHALRVLVSVSLVMACLVGGGTPAVAQDAMIERVLRAQVFNKAFDGFDYYYVTIEDDQVQADGSREVTAVAGGKFLQNTKRLKVLVLMVGEQVIGGQVLEGTGLPPCLTPEQGHSSL